MTKKTAKNPCKAASCTCTDDFCVHKCCSLMRERARRALILTLVATRSRFTQGSPAHVGITKELRDSGWKPTTQEAAETSNLTHEFNEAAEQSAATAIAEGLKQQRESTELEHELTRLVASLPSLESANNIGLAMTFFFRVQSEAKGTTMELAFKAAETRCKVPRFLALLRVAHRTRAGWDKACHDVMKSIDDHYLSGAKQAITKGMVQARGEDPTLYADRILTMIDTYTYFASIQGRSVDIEEMARVWVDGLDAGISMTVCVALAGEATYTIKRALNAARVAHNAWVRTNGGITPLQALHHGPSPLQALHSGTPILQIPAAHTQPVAPPMDAALIQKMFDDQTAQADRRYDDQAAHIQSMEVRLESRLEAPPGVQYTRFPCVFPACRGALHRWDDCPNRRDCRYCRKPGHHVEACFVKYPHMAPPSMRNSPTKAAARPWSKPSNRYQSPPRNHKDRDRDYKDRNRDNRDRRTPRQNNRDQSPPRNDRDRPRHASASGDARSPAAAPVQGAAGHRG